MSALRTVVAAAALAVAGFAASANAAVVNPGKIQVNPNLRVHLCYPHYERKIVYRHHAKYLIVYYVDRFCHKHVVRVIRLGRYYAAR
jgi:hypothetical protein